MASLLRNFAGPPDRCVWRMQGLAVSGPHHISNILWVARTVIRAVLPEDARSSIFFRLRPKIRSSRAGRFVAQPETSTHPHLVLDRSASNPYRTGRTIRCSERPTSLRLSCALFYFYFLLFFSLFSLPAPQPLQLRNADSSGHNCCSVALWPTRESKKNHTQPVHP